MANGTNGLTKADLQSMVDDATEILDAVYQPESTREELASAVGQALDILSGEEDEEEEDDSATPSDDDQD